MAEELSRYTSDKVLGHTAFRNERMRTNEFETRPLRWPGRGGVSFSVASDHRDRDRCDQPLRSRCRGQHHRSVLTFSLSLPPSPPLSLSFLLFIFLPQPFLCRSHVLFSHFILLPPKPSPSMSPSRDFVLRRIAELLAAANVLLESN